ncbi:macrolide family glycosyltransferase [Amycolatopsis minnesotensis]|uniref:Glycosyltransferase n=1 Tax=Amycolatopsis minnesotensis TaxID=337894 RepID=A0ABN2RHD2_9PSEU
MSHIAFCVPFGAGHVNPTLGLAAELLARGHRVSYAVHSSMAGRAEAIGAEVLAYESKMLGEFDEPPEFGRGELPKVMAAMLRETKRLVPEMIARYEGDEPDLVVHDGPIAWWGRFLAAHWGVPVVTSWPNLVSNEHWSMTRYVDVNRASPRLLLTFLRMAVFAKKYRLRADTVVNGSTDLPQLVFVPRAFQFEGGTFTGAHHFVGPGLGDRSAFQGGWAPPGDRPVVLVSLGTAYNDRPEFYRTCLDALAGRDEHVVLSVGEKIDPAGLGALPSNVEAHQSVPQLAVLERACAFVTHAGMGSTMEALHFGVPTVAIPQMPEQRANADRLAQLGLGVHLPPANVTAASLSAALDSVRGNEEMAANLASMRDEIKRAGGVRAAADVVEAELR